MSKSATNSSEELYPDTEHTSYPEIIAQRNLRMFVNTSLLQIACTLWMIQPIFWRKKWGKLSGATFLGSGTAFNENPPIAAKMYGNKIDVAVDNKTKYDLVDSRASFSVNSETYLRLLRKVMFPSDKHVVLKTANESYVRPMEKCVLRLTINRRSFPFEFIVLPRCNATTSSLVGIF